MGINHKNITFSRLYKAIKLICSALSQTEMTDFSTLSYTTLTSKIATLSYTWSLKKVPLRAEPPRIGHYREYPPLPDLKTEKQLRGCQRGAYILVWHRVWIMKLLHGALPGLPLTQSRVVFDVSVENSWNKRNVWKGIRLFSCWKIPGRNLDFMSSNPFSNISLRLSRPFFVWNETDLGKW